MLSVSDTVLRRTFGDLCPLSCDERDHAWDKCTWDLVKEPSRDSESDIEMDLKEILF